jgi:prepilin-type N-terminal cleavage/methylation domain-containing protein
VAAFTLIEMVTVIAILATLMTAGVSLLNGTGAQSRKTGTDMLSGLIEQARTKAITTRSNVLLVVAEPGALPAQDERCRIGMFKVEDNWLENPTNIKNAQLLSRWQVLNTGIVLLPGDVDENSVKVPNALSQDKITITYGGTKNLTVKVYAIGFNSRGGLSYPTGSTPVAFRIAEGGYRGPQRAPKANERGDEKTISENRLKIGRVTARPYQIDG